MTPVSSSSLFDTSLPCQEIIIFFHFKLILYIVDAINIVYVLIKLVIYFILPKIGFPVHSYGCFLYFTDLVIMSHFLAKSKEHSAFMVMKFLSA